MLRQRDSVSVFGWILVWELINITGAKMTMGIFSHVMKVESFFVVSLMVIPCSHDLLINRHVQLALAALSCCSPCARSELALCR